MFEAANASLLGNRRINQDRCIILNDNNCVLLMLSDGLGGHPKGEVAAQILIDTGRAAFAAIPKPVADPQDFLERILYAAHEAILEFGSQLTPPIQPRATAVLALIQAGYLFWCHLGDSRIYLFRNQQILLRSRDHSVVESMMKHDKSPTDNLVRYRNLVTHCLGSTGRKFVVFRNEPVCLQPLDKVLLCTDGLWGQFTDEILNLRMYRSNSVENLTFQLAKDADHIGSPHSDNITLIILQWLNAEPNSRDPQIKAAPTRPQTKVISASKDQHPAQLKTPSPTSDVDKELQEAISTLLSAIDEFSSRNIPG